MKHKLFALLMAGALMAQAGIASFADGEQAAQTGPLTTEHPIFWGVTSFPFRVVTGSTGLALGAVAGGLKGIADTQTKFAEDTYGRMDENPMLLPVGLIGTAAAFPVGFLTGAPPQAAEYGSKAFMWWSKF